MYSTRNLPKAIKCSKDNGVSALWSTSRRQQTTDSTTRETLLDRTCAAIGNVELLGRAEAHGGKNGDEGEEREQQEAWNGHCDVKQNGKASASQCLASPTRVNELKLNNPDSNMRAIYAHKNRAWGRVAKTAKR